VGGAREIGVCSIIATHNATLYPFVYLLTDDRQSSFNMQPLMVIAVTGQQEMNEMKK